MNTFFLNPECINPYRVAIKLLLTRIRWDLNIESWRSRKKMQKYKTRYQGCKAIILCNGPSLLQVDFEMLASRNIFTFGLNKINLLFDKVEFRPSCIVAMNPYVLQQNCSFYNTTKIPLFLDGCGLKYGIQRSDHICFLNSVSLKGTFAKDCSMSVFQGYTVTYIAMQLAFHMGFAAVAIVGCDHNFETKGQSNEVVKSGQSDPNHFDPNYFAGGNLWQLPDLFESEMAYRMALQTYQQSGKKLYNATVGGQLTVLPRVSLTEFIAS